MKTEPSDTKTVYCPSCFHVVEDQRVPAGGAQEVHVASIATREGEAIVHRDGSKARIVQRW